MINFVISQKIKFEISLISCFRQKFSPWKCALCPCDLICIPPCVDNNPHYSGLVSFTTSRSKQSEGPANSVYVNRFQLVLARVVKNIWPPLFTAPSPTPALRPSTLLQFTYFLFFFFTFLRFLKIIFFLFSVTTILQGKNSNFPYSNF